MDFLRDLSSKQVKTLSRPFLARRLTPGLLFLLGCAVFQNPAFSEEDSPPLPTEPPPPQVVMPESSTSALSPPLAPPAPPPPVPRREQPARPSPRSSGSSDDKTKASGPNRGDFTKKKVWASFNLGVGFLFYGQTLVAQYNNLFGLGGFRGRFIVSSDIELYLDAYSSIGSIMSTRPSLTSLWAGGRAGIGYTPFSMSPVRFTLGFDEAVSTLIVSDQSFGYNPVFRFGVLMMLQFGLGGNWSVRLDGKIAPVSAAQISQSEISGGVSLIRLWPKRGNGWEFRGEGGRMPFVTKDGTRVEQYTLLGSVGYLF